MNLKEVLGAIVGLIISVWILSPVPEISIIVGMVTGNATSRILGIPSYFKWIFTAMGVPIGYFFLHRMGIMDAIEKKAGLKEVTKMETNEEDEENVIVVDGIEVKELDLEDMDSRGRPKESSGTPPKDGGKSVGKEYYDKKRSRKMRKKYLKGNE